MRGVQVRSDPRRIVRSVVAAAQGQSSPPAIDQAKHSNLWIERRSGLGEQHCVPPGKLLLWEQFSADTTQGYDIRGSKPTPQHPDFRHKESKVPPWLDNRHKPAWIDSQLATVVVGSRMTTETASTFLQGPGAIPASEGQSEVGIHRKLCDDGLVSDAVDALEQLVQRGCHVSSNLFYRALRKCIQSKDLASGRRIHALIVKSGYEGDAFLATHLIGLYASHGKLEEAMREFTKVSTPDAYNWATIIFAFARHGGAADAVEAVRLYRQMCKSTTIEPDGCLYSAVLKACTAAKDLDAGREVHGHILASSRRPDTLVQAGLVHMYAKCGSLGDARRLFDELMQRSVETWTAMMAGYVQQGMGEEALSLYRKMKQEGVTPDSITYNCLLQACASVGVVALDEGKHLHAEIEQRGLQNSSVLGVSLVNMYAKCGSLEEAHRLLDKFRQSIVAWTAVIAAYVQQGMGQEALSLYKNMQQEGLTPPDSVTYVCLLQACAVIGVDALQEGRQLHAEIKQQGLEEGLVVGGSLVNMYAKCGSLEEARSHFDRLPERNMVAWNAMIAGYVQQGRGQDALNLYSIMQGEGLDPDSVTYVCLLQACAAVAALPLGEQLHAEIDAMGLQADSNIGAALVNMYAKCGCMSESQRVFDSLSERSIEAWGALSSGYARQGSSRVVFQSFDNMRLEGIFPDEVIFLSVLTVCSHVGLVDKGREYFDLMRRQYGINATMEHFICMVDLLGRAGHLDEALHMVMTMPFPPNDVLWRTLLGACRKWENVEIGRHAFNGAVCINEKDAASYVLMSNIYASNQMWEAAKEMQARRTITGARKMPAQSWWTDMDGVVHTFAAGDMEHFGNVGACARLPQLFPETEGYVPHLDSSLLDTMNLEKQTELCGRGRDWPLHMF